MKDILRLILITISFISFAQATDISKVINTIQTPKEVQSKDEALVETTGVKKFYKEELVEDKNAQNVHINSFKILHNTSIKSEKLLDLLNEYKDKDLSFNDMKYIASLITQAYRKEGYITTRAYIPVQTMSNGILEIAVIEGEYGKLYLINNSDVNSAFLQDILDDVKTQGLIQTDSLERGLLIINDIPGIYVSKSFISAGDIVGSSDYTIEVEERNFYDGYIIADNYGQEATGTNKVLAGLNIYNLLKIGDKLSLTTQLSQGENLLYGGLSYSFALHKSGLRAEVAYSHTEYTLAKEYSSLDSLGNAKTYYAKLSFPLIKRRVESLNISLKVNNSDLKDEIRSTDFISKKNLLSSKLNLDYTRKNINLFGLNQGIRANISLNNGYLDIKDADQKALDKTGANTQGAYNKIELGIDTTINFTQNILLDASLGYQHALGDKNLDGMEDFYIGGTYGVKLYSEGELSAENGYLFNTEMKYILPNIEDYLHKLGFFYDAAKIDMQNSIATFESTTLQDAGIGYYLNYKNFFGNIQVAWKIDNQNTITTSDDDYKILAMGGFSF